MSEKAKIVARSYVDSAVVITGGTAGVGLASACQFADIGVTRIALIGRNAERGAAACKTVQARAPKAQVEFIAGDANQLDQAEFAAGEALKRLGRIDVLINSTIGIYKPEPLQRIPPAEIAQIMLQTVLAPMHMSRLVIETMRDNGGGVILNMASDAAKVPTPGETILGAAMSAIVLFSRTLAMEVKRYGVRVNAVTPSLIEGTATASLMCREGFSAKLFEKIAGMADLGVATPDDLAALLVFLSGPQAGRITGQTISVNGGISAS